LNKVFLVGRLGRDPEMNEARRNPHALILSNAPEVCPTCQARITKCWSLRDGWILYCPACRVRGELAVLEGLRRQRLSGKIRSSRKRTRWRPQDPAVQNKFERMLS